MNTRGNWLRALLAVAFIGTSGVIFWFVLKPRFFQETRGPASLAPSYVFLDLEGPALQDAVKKRLVQDAKAFQRTGDFGAELGMFALRDESGRVRTACEMYPRLRLVYVAGDMAVNGDKPILSVEGACEAANDAEHIEPLLVPYDALKQQDPEAKVFPEDMTYGNTVETKNLEDAWPDVWILEKIELIDQNGLTAVTVSDIDMRNLRNGQLVQIK